MKKQEFLKKLEQILRKLKKDERDKYIEYYDEMISDIMEKGIPEEEAIKSQGSVEEIAKEILADTNPSDLRNWDWKGIVLSAVSIGLLLICAIPLIVKVRFGLQMSSSIGIIGGADGPTSVFVAGKIGTPWGLYIVTAIAVIVTILYFVKKYKKRRE